jgi:plasmid maintenance system killer protein
MQTRIQIKYEKVMRALENDLLLQYEIEVNEGWKLVFLLILKL